MKSMRPVKDEMKEMWAYFKKRMKEIVIPIVILLVIFISGLFLVSLFSGCNKFKLDEYEDDNSVEELVEAISKQQLGVEIEFSPEVENGRAK